MQHSNIEKEILFGLLHSTHESMKWMWQIVMGGALVIAVQTIYPDLKVFFSNTPITQHNIQVLSLFFLVYLPFFFRVFYGNNRYIDLNYVEIMFLKNTEISDMVHLNQFTGISRFLDIFALLMHGILFIFLASILANPKEFIIAIIFFLGFNVLYLFFVVLRNGVKIKIPDIKNYTKRMYSKYIHEKPRNDVLILWVLNNFFHAILLLLLYQLIGICFNEIIFIYISIIFLILNSSIDIIYTWEFYFPDMEELAKAISEKRN